MNKILIALMLVLLTNPLYAAQTQKTIINDTVITKASPVAQGDIYIGDADKVAFFITYDSNRTTAAITANVTAAISIDGVNWQDISWFDVAGGVTPVTSEDLNFSNPSDGNYIGMLEYGVTAPYLKIYMKVNNLTDASILGPVEAATVTVTVIEKK